tara:strand:- start:1698 stop:2798 length:1101 start_codon:yes stop_codon:yes gene_type:complete
MNEVLFNIGPFDVNIWNILVLVLIFYLAFKGKKEAGKLIDKYLAKAEINIKGKKLARLKLISQSVYFLAFYVCIISLRVNNPTVGFEDLLNYPIIKISKFEFSFYHILVILTVLFSARISVFFTRLYIVKKLRENPSHDEGNEYIYTQLAKYVIYVFAFLFCFRALNVPLTNLFIGSTALLVGIGLGLQDAFRDLIAGFILLLEGNIKVGDVVKISSTSQEDDLVVRIKKINIRTTQIQTWEGNVLVIPNTILTRDKVENWSHGSKLTRFIINVTVAYGSNTELVKDLLKEAANSHPKVKKTHQVIVRLADFGDNGLHMELIFWADQHWDVKTYKSEIRFEIDRLFRKHNIQIPFPQRTLHMPTQD